MPPEDDDDQLDQEDREDPPVEGLGPKGEKALEAERAARKTAERRARDLEKQALEAQSMLRQERFGRFKAQHEWLEESDLEGVDLSAWEQKIERLAAIAGGQKKDAAATGDQADERAEMERFAQRAGGAGRKDQQSSYTAKELYEQHQDGKITSAQLAQMVQSGQMTPTKR